MKNTCWFAVLNTLMITSMLISCKTMDQTAPSNATSTYPVPQIKSNTIGHNETMVSGHLIKKKGSEYFIIDSILMRGNSAPVISRGEKISIHKFLNDKPPLLEKVDGILISKVANQAHAIIWNFKLIKE